MLTSKESCGINSLLFLKRIFTFLLGVMAGTGFYIKASFANVCFLPSMRGGECGMSMENISLGLSGKCPEGYIEKNGKCIYNCQGYTYSSTAANEMMSNNFECEKCPGANLYKCSRCKTGYRKKVMSNTCVHICETQGYTVTAEEKQSKTDKNFTCVQCANGDFYKCACPDGLEENSEGVCANNECISSGYTLNEVEKTQCTETNRVIETCPDSSSEYKYYTCGDCIEGYLDVNGECKQRKCPSDYLEGNTNDGCHSCQSCKEVNNKTYYKCTESVQTGYKLEGGKCLCDTEKGFSMSNGSCVCSSANHLVLSGNKCVCATGYTLSGGKCKPSDETLYCGDNRESGKLKDRLANDVLPENMSPYRCYVKGNVVGGKQRYNEICCLSDSITQQDYAECTSHYNEVGESGNPLAEEGCFVRGFNIPESGDPTYSAGAPVYASGDPYTYNEGAPILNEYLPERVGPQYCSAELEAMAGYLPTFDPDGNKSIITPFMRNSLKDNKSSGNVCSLMARYLNNSVNNEYYVRGTYGAPEYRTYTKNQILAGYGTATYGTNPYPRTDYNDPYYFDATVREPIVLGTSASCHWGYGCDDTGHNYYYNTSIGTTGAYNLVNFGNSSHPDHGFTRAQLAFYDACCAVQLAADMDETLAPPRSPNAQCYETNRGSLQSILNDYPDNPHRYVRYARSADGDVSYESKPNYESGPGHWWYSTTSLPYTKYEVLPSTYVGNKSWNNCLYNNRGVRACYSGCAYSPNKDMSGDTIYSPSEYTCTAY